MYLKRSFLIIFILLSNCVSAQIEGCRIPGTNTIYPISNSTNYLLGVLTINGVSIQLPIRIFKTNVTVETVISCSIPHLASANPLFPAACYYGTPASILGIVTCNDCLVGERVEYTTTLECNLDDYSWTLGAAAGLFGVFIIRRRNKP